MEVDLELRLMIILVLLDLELEQVQIGGAVEEGVCIFLLDRVFVFSKYTFRSTLWSYNLYVPMKLIFFNFIISYTCLMEVFDILI